MCKQSLALLLVSLASCFSEPADEIHVSLSLAEQDFRSLPVIASGATSLLLTDAPDSHGVIEARVDIEGASEVDFAGLRLVVNVNGAPLDVRIVRQHVGAQDLQAGLTASVLHDGDVVAVEFRARALTQVLQPAGAGYTTRLEVDWREHSLEHLREASTADLDTSEVIATPVNATTFAPRATPAPSAPAPGSTTATFAVAAEVTSGLDVTVQAVRGKITYLGTDDLVPGLALALFSSGVASEVSGQHVGTVGPGDVLELFSSPNAAASPAPRAAAGTAASAGAVAGGKAIIAVEIDYDIDDGTPGVSTDLLYFVADVP